MIRQICRSQRHPELKFENPRSQMTERRPREVYIEKNQPHILYQHSHNHLSDPYFALVFKAVESREEIAADSII